MTMLSRYLADLRASIPLEWNRFWFTPRDPFVLCVARILVGLLTIYYVASFSGDLMRWFAADGLLGPDTVRPLLGASRAGPVEPRWVFRFSYLMLCTRPWQLWAAHGIGLAIVGAWTAGIWTRLTGILSLVVALSYLHRAPMLAGPFEPALMMLLLYLSLAPCGSCLSWDARRWLAGDKASSLDRQSAASTDSSVMATIATRLVQIHLAAIVGTMGLEKLAEYCWWEGDAVWWLLTRSESRLVDWTFIRGPLGMELIAAWSCAIVLIEIFFPILIWQRLARPIILALALTTWFMMALVTGWVAFHAALAIGSIHYLEPMTLRAVLGAHRGSGLATSAHEARRRR